MQAIELIDQPRIEGWSITDGARWAVSLKTATAISVFDDHLVVSFGTNPPLYVSVVGKKKIDQPKELVTAFTRQVLNNGILL